MFRRSGLALIAGLAIATFAPDVFAQYVKDLARVDGVREQMLSGPGLVVGLPDTGDSSRSALTKKLYSDFLYNHKIDLSEDDFRSRNVAVVMVTAQVSSLTKVGSRIEVTISSLGDAKSLKGGWLLETALVGVGGGDQVLALAQGGVKVKADGEPTVGVGQAILEEDISIPIDIASGSLDLILDQPDFSTASRIARAINDLPYFVLTVEDELPIAHATDAGQVRVKIPTRFRNDERVVGFVSRVMGEVKVTDVDRAATVVISEKDQLVTVNGRVRVAPVFIVVGDLQIRIPPAGVGGGDQDLPLLLDVMDALRDQGITSQQMPAIIRSIDGAGALVGKLKELP